jgi:hypothetical protein
MMKVKIMDTFRIMSNGLPFWIKPPFFTHLAKYALDSCRWQIYKQIEKKKNKI